jgi:hypothetical protein
VRTALAAPPLSATRRAATPRLAAGPRRALGAGTRHQVAAQVACGRARTPASLARLAEKRVRGGGFGNAGGGAQIGRRSRARNAAWGPHVCTPHAGSQITSKVRRGRHQSTGGCTQRQPKTPGSHACDNQVAPASATTLQACRRGAALRGLLLACPRHGPARTLFAEVLSPQSLGAGKPAPARCEQEGASGGARRCARGTGAGGERAAGRSTAAG